MVTQNRLIAGNWKMNGLGAEAVTLARGITEKAAGAPPTCDVAVCPPFTALHAVAAVLDGSPVALGGQDCHEATSGAFTGSVSPAMLDDVGCHYVIVGHSERRHGLGEKNATVLGKAASAIAAGLVPIICVGETLEEREGGRATEVVSAQIAGSVPPEGGAVVVAYEPVWAIGTGKTASADDIAGMHNHIRDQLTRIRADGAGIPIQYGGSAKPENAAEILAITNVGGLLVGGASLQPGSFWDIVQAV